MAMRARVELTGCLTHEGNGRKFKKGQPQILTNSSDIKYYQGQACFSVTVLETKKSKVKEPEPDPSKDSGAGNTGGDDDDADETYTAEELEEHKKADLKEIAAEMGLDVGGTKKELIERIIDNQQ